MAIVSILSVFAIASCQRKELEKQVLSINGRPLIVEVARSEKEREKGLMFREKLGWNEGMLFVFSEDEVLSFWMKNTSISLSIAFMDKTGKVTDIFDMAPFDVRPVSSSRTGRFAVEVNRGFFDECGLKVGDRIDLGSIIEK